MAISSIFRIAIIRIASLFYVNKRSKVIFYHDIHSDRKYTEMSTPIELFKKHIDIIRGNGYEIVSEITSPYKQIEICFDDAFLGLYENIEIIKKLNVPIHLFVITSFMNKDKYINKEQLLELSKLNQITISSHTHTHQILSDISQGELLTELKKSKLILNDLLNSEMQSLCFPEGKFNKKVVKEAKELSYNKLYSSIPGFYYDEFLPNVKRRSLVQFAKEKEFRAILRGGDHILALWYKLKHFVK